MSSLEFIIYERATGRVRTVLTTPPDQLDCNVPEGCSAAMVDVPEGCLYVCPETLQPLPDARPPAPEPGCTWLADEQRWQTAAEHAVRTNTALQRQIEALEAAQARPQRELLLHLTGVARLPAEDGQRLLARLTELDAHIAALRAQRVAYPDTAKTAPQGPDHEPQPAG